MVFNQDDTVGMVPLLEAKKDSDGEITSMSSVLGAMKSKQNGYNDAGHYGRKPAKKARRKVKFINASYFKSTSNSDSNNNSSDILFCTICADSEVKNDKNNSLFQESNKNVNNIVHIDKVGDNSSIENRNIITESAIEGSVATSDAFSNASADDARGEKDKVGTTSNRSNNVLAVEKSNERWTVPPTSDVHDDAIRIEPRLVYAGGGCVVSASAARNDGITKEEEMTLVRSVFAVQGICCATEVPTVRKIVLSLPGISTMQINITLKRVYVQHYPHHLSNDVDKKEQKLTTGVTARQIAEQLSKEGFYAKVIQDGGTCFRSSLNESDFGQTNLRVVHSNLMKSDVNKIQHLLTETHGQAVQSLNIDSMTGMVSIRHAVQVLSAAEIQNTLEMLGYETVVTHDAASDVAWRIHGLQDLPRSKLVESTILISNLTKRDMDIVQNAMKQEYIRSQVWAIHSHLNSQTAKVEHNPKLVSISSICSVLGRHGLEAQVLHDGAIEKAYLPMKILDQGMDATERSTNSQAPLTINDDKDNLCEHDYKLKIHVILSGLFWLVSTVGELLGGDMAWERCMEYSGLLSVMFGLPPVAVKAFRTLKRYEFDANCMMVTAAIGALCLDEINEAASVSFLFAVSEYLERHASSKARIALSQIMNLRPEFAYLLHPQTKERVVVPADRVPLGSLISVRTGDKIAADGIVVEGSSSVDESILTGESIPIHKTIDSQVSGGSINIGMTQLIVRTTASVADSKVSKLIRSVEEAHSNRSATEKMVDEFACAYTPVVVILAFFMATVSWFFGSQIGRQWTLNALMIVVIACPCALTISTPITYAASMAAIAKHGVVVKGGATLEALGSVDTVVLDKTGTLTEGKFSVTGLDHIGTTFTPREMLTLLAIMEAPSSHPLSTTLVKAAKRAGVTIPSQTDIREHTVLQGEGVTALVDGKRVYVGNERLFERMGMLELIPICNRKLVDKWSANGATVGYIGMDGEGIIGSFCMSDIVRPQAIHAVKALHSGGIDVVMLTGDGDGAAKAVAAEVGIPPNSVHSKLLPEDKKRYVMELKQKEVTSSYPYAWCKKFQSQSRLLFCGDGINDALALSEADVGVSMGEGAALALEMSDVTLMDSDLTKLVYVIRMGTRVLHTIRENIALSVLCKVIVVALTFAGYMTLLFAIASDVGVMLLVTLNGMKLLPEETCSASLKGMSEETDKDEGSHKDAIELPLCRPSNHELESVSAATMIV